MNEKFIAQLVALLMSFTSFAYLAIIKYMVVIPHGIETISLHGIALYSPGLVLYLLAILTYIYKG